MMMATGTTGSDDYQAYVCEDDFQDCEDEHAFVVSDDVDEYLASNDKDYAEALVTMKQSRDYMNKVRTARGFFKGKIEGVLDESTAAGGQPTGSKGKPKGRGKTNSKGKSTNKCDNCGRYDHSTADCPRGSGSSGIGKGKTAPPTMRPTKGKKRGRAAMGYGGGGFKRKFGMWVMGAAAYVNGIPGLGAPPPRSNTSKPNISMIMTATSVIPHDFENEDYENYMENNFSFVTIAEQSDHSTRFRCDEQHRLHRLAHEGRESHQVLRTSAGEGALPTPFRRTWRN